MGDITEPENQPVLVSFASICKRKWKQKPTRSVKEDEEGPLSGLEEPLPGAEEEAEQEATSRSLSLTELWYM